MNFVKIISSKIDDKYRRVIKYLRLGKDDVRENLQAGPYGFDGSPVKDMIAIYAPTLQNGNAVIIGYINKNKANLKPGEVIMYSTDANGVQKMALKMLDDGTAEFGGKTDNMIRYIPLDAGLQSEAAAINVELVKIAAVLNSIIPGSYVPTPVTVNISASKIDEIKTSS